MPKQQYKWTVLPQRAVRHGAASKLRPKAKVGFHSGSDRDLGGTTVVLLEVDSQWEGQMMRDDL